MASTSIGNGWTRLTQNEMVHFVANLEIVKVEFTPDTIAATAVPYEDENGLRKVSATLPANVDYRLTGDVSPIKSQGTCGCCWSFTTVGTYESWMMLKGEAEYDLS